MLLLRTSTPLATAAAAAVAALAFSAGCSSTDDKAACNKILETVRNVGTDASTQTADPAAAGQIYIDGAADVRAASHDVSDDVAAASENLATQLENVGNSLVNLDTSNPQMPDISSFTSAGEQMQNACT